MKREGWSVRDWLRDCFGRRMKWLEEAIKREAGEEFGSLGVLFRDIMGITKDTDRERNM